MGTVGTILNLPALQLYAFASPGHEMGSLSVTVTPIPEPEIYAMLGVGLGFMGWAARRKKRKEAA